MKKTLFLAIVIFLSAGIEAQIFYSDNQQIIKNLVSNSFVLVEQSYQLEDTVSHQRFGRNNLPEFGKLRGIAVKTKDGYVTNNNLLAPWSVDENCVRYLSQYRGVISKTIIYEITDTIASSRDIVSHHAASQNQYLSLINDSVFQNDGFAIVQTSEKTEGWIVWVAAKNDIDSLEGGDDIIYYIYKKEIDVQNDSISYEVATPTTDNKIIGGIFIVPGHSHIGYLEFSLCGMIINNEGSWKIILNKFDSISSVSNHIEQQETTLTPVNTESRKKNKNSKKNRNNE